MTQYDELDESQRADVDRLLGDLGDDRHHGLLREILSTGVNLTDEVHDPLDLKIIASALAEMREAFAMFRPYRHARKVSVFGSARTAAHDPLYEQTKALAAALAGAGWMVITGAGPGLMQAANEGAGRERSFGVTIRLPWESGANAVLLGDSKVVSMKYFFTRKLMLVKESQAFVCLPGGFGTLDETFELLTLTQTGKGAPVPIVFLDTPGGTYWTHMARLIREELAAGGYIDAEDERLFLVTDDAGAALREIERFYSNFHSLRFVGDRLVVRMHRSLSNTAIAALNEEFAELVRTGSIDRAGPTRAERADDDQLGLHRIAFAFEPRRAGRLRLLIDRVNDR